MAPYIPQGIIKNASRQVGLQICRMPSGYCITAHESASDATRGNSILIEVNDDELDYLIGVFLKAQMEK